MARTIELGTITVYPYAELDESAQDNARENWRARIAAGWDSSDIEDVSNVIVYALAEKLRSPEWDTYGPGDFPGIDRVKLTGWDIDRGQYVELDGSLTRDNAPALPWVDGLESVTLERRGLWLVLADDEPSEDALQVMRDALTDAIDAAWRAGRDEYEYRFSDEYVLGEIEANEAEFTSEGEIYP